MKKIKMTIQKKVALRNSKSHLHSIKSQKMMELPTILKSKTDLDLSNFLNKLTLMMNSITQKTLTKSLSYNKIIQLLISKIALTLKTLIKKQNLLSIISEPKKPKIYLPKKIKYIKLFKKLSNSPKKINQKSQNPNSIHPANLTYLLLAKILSLIENK